MITALKIFVFTILVCLFYSYVGQMVPQKVTYPPEDTEFSASMTTEELVEVGREIVGGKGTCLTCHTIGSEGSALRFPDLGNIGAVAATRKDGYSDIDYLAESIYEPNTFIVPGFQPGMPSIHQPPINLNDQEILAVIAYMQSLGGTPTVTMETTHNYSGSSPAASGPEQTVATASGPATLDGAVLFNTYLCGSCHSLDAPTTLVGPSLYDVGNRLTKAQLYESIMDPDATIAEGFSAGVMTATLGAVGFNDKVTPGQVKALVDFLASKKGE